MEKYIICLWQNFEGQREYVITTVRIKTQAYTWLKILLKISDLLEKINTL